MTKSRPFLVVPLQGKWIFEIQRFMGRELHEPVSPGMALCVARLKAMCLSERNATLFGMPLRITLFELNTKMVETHKQQVWLYLSI
ncbi:MAG: hypothetical protein CVV51_00980 [Spirochaetae bacterium HGW-Spirochaetae-7]|jgi:hypothetical protein|nr:MAG: hypothetical protein CVV51_00980 [Spirochaetae bacterium HGW-Spirochaetae-7]